MDRLIHDLRYAFRALWKSPGFAGVAVLTLALGIGANSAIFSVVDRLVLRPPSPWPDSERMVVIGWGWGADLIDALPPAPAQFWKDNARSFEAFAITSESELLLTGTTEPERLSGLLVSDGYFRVIGVQPALGRAFVPDEDVVGAPPVAILSDGLWRRRFGADPGVVGGTVTLDDEAYTVVGVMPPGEGIAPGEGLAEADVLLPLRLVANPRAEGANYFAFGRLAPEAPLKAVRAEVEAFTERVRSLYPYVARPGTHFWLEPYTRYLAADGDVRTTLFVLFGAVAFVLLIACANVANLLLARATARQDELAIRAALGAGRGQILRHLLTESMLISLAGGAAGLILAAWGLDGLLALAPADMATSPAGLEGIGLDLRVLGFTLAVSTLGGVGVGLVGALRSSRHDVSRMLKEGGRAHAVGRTGLHARGLLVAAEAALSVVLLVGAGLFIVSFFRLRAVELGFDPEGVYTAEVELRPQQYPTTEATWRFERQVLERVRALPGVTAAGSASNLPLERGLNTRGNVHSPGPRQQGTIEVRAVSPDYLRAIGATLSDGRAFTEFDDADAPPVAMINEAFVRRFLPDREPLGARVSIGRPGNQTPNLVAEGPERTVVCVIHDLRDMAVSREARPTLFVPRAQASDGTTRYMNDSFAAAFAVRTDNPAAVATALRQGIHQADPQQPILRMRPLTDVVSASITSQRFNMILLATFAGLALVLTAVGIYGVVSYTVRQRTHEIGVRIALGAGHGSVLRLVIRQGMATVLLGLAAGMAAALALTRLVASLLYDVSTTDPLTFGSVAFVLGAVALLATYVPARRAARVDPMVALRND